ncbi:MAG: hypothetical protein WAV67_14970 [Dokdonella sp.]
MLPPVGGSRTIRLTHLTTADTKEAAGGGPAKHSTSLVTANRTLKQSAKLATAD